MAKLSGTCKFYNPQKGYGFIAGEDGTDYFCHWSYINKEGFKCLNQGETCTFEPHTAEDGRHHSKSVDGNGDGQPAPKGGKGKGKGKGKGMSPSGKGKGKGFNPMMNMGMNPYGMQQMPYGMQMGGMGMPYGQQQYGMGGQQY